MPQDSFIVRHVKRWWYRSRWHRKHVYRYRPCTLKHHDIMGRWVHTLIKQLAPEHSGSCDDAWVCACGAHMDGGGFDRPLPVARVLRKPTHS